MTEPNELYLCDVNELYLCDPSKNIECSKTGCILNGGSCFKTTKHEYKLDPSPSCLHIPSEKYETCGRCIFENLNENEEPCSDCCHNQLKILPSHFIARDRYMELINKEVEE